MLAFRSVSSGRYVVAVALLVFSPSGFHHFFATKPVRSETNKQYGCQVATMVPWGLVAHSFFGLSEGTRVACET